MARGDRGPGGLGVRQVARAGTQDATIGEFGKRAVDRIVQAEPTLFHEQQDGAGRDQLGAGEHPEEVVLAQRDAGLAVGGAVAEPVHDRASAQQRSRHVGQELLIDLGAQGSVEGVEGVVRHLVFPALKRGL